MKKVSLATEYKFNIGKPAVKSVSMVSVYRFSIVAKDVLRSSMKTAGITDSDKIIQNNKPAVIDLTKEIIETEPYGMSRAKSSAFLFVHGLFWRFESLFWVCFLD